VHTNHSCNYTNTVDNAVNLGAPEKAEWDSTEREDDGKGWLARSGIAAKD
jgi:hypothetical protein